MADLEWAGRLAELAHDRRRTGHPRSDAARQSGGRAAGTPPRSPSGTPARAGRCPATRVATRRRAACSAASRRSSASARRCSVKSREIATTSLSPLGTIRDLLPVRNPADLDLVLDRVQAAGLEGSVDAGEDASRRVAGGARGCCGRSPPRADRQARRWSSGRISRQVPSRASRSIPSGIASSRARFRRSTSCASCSARSFGEREAGGGADRVEQLLAQPQRAVVDEHADRLALVQDRRRDPDLAGSRKLQRLAGAVDIPLLVAPETAELGATGHRAPAAARLPGRAAGRGRAAPGAARRRLPRREPSLDQDAEEGGRQRKRSEQPEPDPDQAGTRRERSEDEPDREEQRARSRRRSAQARADGARRATPRARGGRA